MAERLEQEGRRKVHVLRHSFEPSFPLNNLIQEFTGVEAQPRFLFHSTKEVYVDSATYIRGGYRDEDALVTAVIEQQRRQAFVLGRAVVRPLFRPLHPNQTQAYTRSGIPVGYRLLLVPSNTQRFNSLINSLSVYTNERPQAESYQHHLYVDVPAGTSISGIHSEEGRHEFEETIVNGIEKRLFSAAVTGIRAQEVPFALPRPLNHAKIARV